MVNPVARYPLPGGLEARVLKAIQQFQFETAIKKVEDVRASIIREGSENGTKTLKKFFYKLNKFKDQKKQHRRNIIKNTGLHHQHLPNIPIILSS